MNDIEKQIEKNIKFLKKIEDIAEKISIPNNNKEMLFSGIFRNSLSHYYSINILCERKLYNSSFALIRVLFEGIIRAQYLYCGEFTSEKINNMYNGCNWNNSFPSIKIMCTKIDDKYGSSFYSDIESNSYKAMNDYTHTGSKQISRNFNSENGVIEPNFEQNLIINSLIGINALVKTFSIGYFEKIGLKYGEIQEKDIENFLEYTGL